mmetsp:Transcript_23654/g.93362  ORF Transcript_23654/g.93362 Transcript_23654/m.93362 type:complete len:254 (+) Transcript_23654:152-913(+)
METPTSYLQEPIATLDSRKHPKMMTDFDETGHRKENKLRTSKVLPLQIYLMQNSRAVFERGENVVFAPTDPEFTSLESALPVYETKWAREGSIHGYVLREKETKRELLKVHVHANTDSAFAKVFTGLLNNPLNKYDVKNLGLYSDLKYGQLLGTIEEVFPDNRVFNPKNDFCPRLEMQVTKTLGLHYYMAVTDITEPIGQVQTDVLGRFAPRSEAYKLSLRHCTREEALLWITMLIATDMKRRKSTNNKWRRV